MAPPEMRFCGQCGSRLGIICPDCGFINPQGYRYCGSCGRALVEATGSAPDPTLREPPVIVLDESEPDLSRGVALSPTPLAPLPSLPAAPLTGERRIATSLVADVYRSTDLIELLGTEDWVQLMNQLLQLLAAEVYRFGGRVDQFRGDGLVAFFGASDAHEDDPERAILAALAMLRVVRTRTKSPTEKDIDLRIRVGIHTGEVIVGSVGDVERHREDTAMGEGVAVAARMEAAAEPGTVLVSGDTYHLVEARFEWQPLGEISVKGLSKPMAVYRPLRMRALTEESEPFALSLPMVVGRSAAFTALQDCVEGLRRGRGGIALVTGAKGMGKSVLVNQVRQHFTGIEEANPVGSDDSQFAAPPLTWLFNSSRSYDQAIPYAALAGLLRSWLNRATEQADGDPADWLFHEAATLFGDGAERHYAHLAALLALPILGPAARRLAYLRPEESRRQLFEAVYAWVNALAQRGPLVLVLSDLQFADASSLELLKYCLPVCETAPVLWLASFRPERTSPVWQFRHHVETDYPHRLTNIELPPLTEGQSRALVDQMLGPGTLTEAMAAVVVEKAEGNPYYLREMLYALIQQGLVQQDADGTWRQTRPAQSFNLPGSLQGLLLERIDHLSPDERRVLQIAAVIGSPFWRNVLEIVVNDTDRLQRCLTQLQRAQLIHEQSLEPDLGMRYAFTPSLVREVAYESLLHAQRVAYHLQVTDAIEQVVSPESHWPYHSLLAYHYHQAGNLNRELYHALGAAAEARRAYANDDALAIYGHILGLLDQMESDGVPTEQTQAILELRFEALDGRRQVQERMGNLEASQRDARALVLLAQQLADDPVFMAQALLAQPEVNNPATRDELLAGLKMAQDALSLVQQAGDRHLELRALLAVSQIQHLLKDPGWRTLGDQALELSRQLGDLRMEVGLLLGLGGAYAVDQPDYNLEYQQAALAISQRLQDKETESWLLAALSPQHERSGDYYRQLVEYEQKRVELYREVGNRMGEGHALMFCGQIQALYLGDYEGGLALLEEALERWSETSDKLFPLLRIAQIQAAQGQYAAACDALAQGREVIERVILNLGHAGLCLVEAILLNAQGGAENWRQVLAFQPRIAQMVADDQLSHQYQMAAACETSAARLGLATVAATAAERDEHVREALVASQAALEIYEGFGFTQVIECVAEEIFYRHGLALAANGRIGEAREMLERAYLETMRKHDLIPAASPFRRTFLENIALHRQIIAAHAVAS